MDTVLRDRFERRKSALKLERSSFELHWRELAQFIQPRRGRFFLDDRNKGGDRYTAIINSKATQAHRVARSGLLAGVMSPASPWFEYGTLDPDLNDYQPVREWFFHARQVVLQIFAESNMYSGAATVLGETLLFATGAMIHVDDFEDVARFYPLTAGSYLIGQDARQSITTIIREWEMTAGQIVEKWGKTGKISQSVQNAYDNGNYDAWFPVTHIIEPNAEYNEGKALSKYKKFRSCYYEQGNADKEALLGDAGFDDFPAYVPRWDTTAEDVWGTDCPGMVALGDTKGLQIQERRKAQGIDKMVSPPMQGPPSLRNTPFENLPGGLTIYDDAGDKTAGLRPAYTVNPQLGELRIDMKAVEDRIDTAFYVHLFRAISDMAGVQPRNQLEINKRDQERLLELGPVLQHLHGEFLAHMTSRTFNQAARHGILRPAPPELQGKAVNTKFISTLAMAQRSVAAGAIERLATFVAGVVPFAPNAAAKFDARKAIDIYADITGAPPSVIVSDDVLAQQDQQAAQQQAQAHGAAMAGATADAAQKGASAAESLGNTPGGGDTLLQKINDAIKQRGTQNVFSQPR